MQKCGQDLTNEEFHIRSKRQILDILPIKPVFHEYRQYFCTCPHCHNEQSGGYPHEVSAPIQYGKNIQSFVLYFSIYQYIPYTRLSYLFSHLFNVNISQGSIQNLLTAGAEKATSTYDRIKMELSQSEVIGSDETGTKENGHKTWIWVWQNLLNTYIVPSKSRGYKAIQKGVSKNIYFPKIYVKIEKLYTALHL